MTEPDGSDHGDGDSALDATVTVTPSDDGALVVTLAVQNPTTEPVECTFRDGQRIEAVAERTDSGDGDDETGAECWRYGDGHMFSMSTGTETVPSGGSVSFDATWPDPGPGDYRVRAWLVAAECSVEDAVDLTVD